MQVPAAKRFISAEPLLGALDLTSVNLAKYVVDGLMEWHKSEGRTVDPEHYPKCMPLNALTGWNVGGDDVPSLDWVIVGGESGSGARPMHPDWVRSLRDQCAKLGVSFFFKQWGEWAPYASKYAGDRDERGVWDYAVNLDGHLSRVAMTSSGIATNYSTDTQDGFSCVSRVGKKAAGNLLNGVEWHQFPEVRS